MNERPASITVLRCAGCEAHQRRIAELEALVNDLKLRIMKLFIENRNIKRRVTEALNGESE
ncbi:hypothetical protein [Sinorhizobium fredii]|uniref:hypothetical protein n=1 Tax=Rhizobium fredii TaxID=380 RepID=UPI000595724B|nr:hypothetical protein [Sinorhizobium fredii]WOS62034.1 hypothetical protein SFGR64A_13915 [Sinorhizobium fredii GR64]